MTNQITQNELVIQSNALINARYFLTSDEKKLILMALKNIMAISNPTLEEVAFNQTFNIDIKELHQLSGEKISYKHYAERMRKSVSSLFDRKITLDLDRSIDWIRWITKVSWLKNQNFIQIKLSNEIMPLLIGIQTQFTPCRLQNIILLRLPVSIRLYELLAEYEDFRTRTIEIKQLRYIFDMQNKHLPYHDFQRRVILPAINDINENSNYRVESPVINKNGKTVQSITFNFKVKTGSFNKKHKK